MVKMICERKALPLLDYTMLTSMMGHPVKQCQLEYIHTSQTLYFIFQEVTCTLDQLIKGITVKSQAIAHFHIFHFLRGHCSSKINVCNLHVRTYRV